MKINKALYMILLAAAASLVWACTDSIKEDIATAVSAEGGESLVFEGGFAQTKTQFGSLDGNTAALLWSDGDAIGIFSYSMESTSNINIKANLLRTTAGQANGVFIPVEEIVQTDEETADTVTISYPASGSEQFLVYYPYADGTDIDVDDGGIHAELPSVQTQQNVSDKKIGGNGFSWDMATVGADHKVNFTLKHTMAYIRFVVKTSEFASGYMLKSIQLYDEAGEAALTGDFVFDPATGVTTGVKGSTSPSAKVTVANDDFSASAGEQELYLTVLPGNFSGSTFMVVVTYAKQGGGSVSIPMSLGKTLNLSAANMYTITLDNVGTSSNTCKWYEPVETRELLDNWAYGPQNTYFAERKAKGEGVTALKLDIKARGDFSKVVEPAYYGLLTSSDMGTRKLLQLPDGTTAYESVPTHAVNSDYTIDVEVMDQGSGNGRWGVVAIYDKDYNIIWSYMIWGYITGDEPGDVEYPSQGFKLLDRAIGQEHSNAYSAEHGAITASTACFQWGRKDPFMWSNSGITHYNQQLATADVDIAYAIAHPTLIFGYVNSGGVNSAGDWKVDAHQENLWGAANTSGSDIDNGLTGVKTIYDPCPEGYRVCDGKVLSVVASRGQLWETAKNQKNQDASRLVSTSPFYGSASVVAYPLGNDQYDYWLYGGAHWGSNASWGNRTSSNNNHGYLYWGNSSAPNGRSSILEGCYFSSGWSTATSAVRAQGFAVRCQKEE